MITAGLLVIELAKSLRACSVGLDYVKFGPVDLDVGRSLDTILFSPIEVSKCVNNRFDNAFEEILFLFSGSDLCFRGAHVYRLNDASKTCEGSFEAQ